MMYAPGAGYPGSYTLLAVGTPVEQVAHAISSGFRVNVLARSRSRVAAVRGVQDPSSVRYPQDPARVRDVD